MTFSLALATAAAFNLVCTGEEMFISKDGEVTKHPYAITYRVDLASERWCAGDCPMTMPLARVDSTNIEFYDNSNADQTSFNNAGVNRETGTMTVMVKNYAGVSSIIAQCEKAEFTGFPTRKF